MPYSRTCYVSKHKSQGSTWKTKVWIYSNLFQIQTFNHTNWLGYLCVRCSIKRFYINQSSSQLKATRFYAARSILVFHEQLLKTLQIHACGGLLFLMNKLTAGEIPAQCCFSAGLTNEWPTLVKLDNKSVREPDSWERKRKKKPGDQRAVFQ